jgi:hypothetical protein
LLRPVALMMPMVTVWLSWNGLPTAITYSPTLALDESPQARVGKPFPSTLMTAMSVTGSVPTSVPFRRRRSAVVIAICLACSITWLLVTITPSGLTITPEPRLVLRSSCGIRKGRSRPKNSRKNGSLKNGDRSVR